MRTGDRHLPAVAMPLVESATLRSPHSQAWPGAIEKLVQRDLSTVVPGSRPAIPWSAGLDESSVTVSVALSRVCDAAARQTVRFSLPLAKPAAPVVVSAACTTTVLSGCMTPSDTVSGCAPPSQLL